MRMILKITCLILLAQSVNAKVACEDVFRRDNAFGTIKTSFQHNKRYSNEINVKSPILNQYALGTCHLHAWVASIEKSQFKRTGVPLKVSVPYLSASHWIDRAMNTIMSKVDYEKKENKLSVDLGASIISSRAAIRKFGIVPEGVWAPNTRFDRAPLAGRLEEYMVNRIGKAKWDIAREISPEKKHEIKERAELDLTTIFEDIAGGIPETFEYGGKTYTPQEFAREKFPEIYEPRVNVFVNSSPKDRTSRAIVDGDLEVETSVAFTEIIARSAIDAGEPVYLSYEHNGNYVDKKSGVMSISAFNLPKNAGPMTREQRAVFGTRDGGHAVQLVGYDVDPATGKVIKWKIQNSWGRAAGDHGIYHMYADYFSEFVKGVSFSADANVPLPRNEVETLKQLKFEF